MSRENVRRRPGRPKGGTGPVASGEGPGAAPADGRVHDAAGFQDGAVLLFGRHGWVRDTALCMGVNESTVWRWVNAGPTMPGPALAAMTAWLRIHALTGELPTPQGSQGPS